MAGGPTSGGGFGPLIQPVQEAMTINGGMATVFSTSVELDLFVRFGGEVQVANGPDPTGAPWLQYVDRLPWTLPSGDGSKTRNCATQKSAGTLSHGIQGIIN